MTLWDSTFSSTTDSSHHDMHRLAQMLTPAWSKLAIAGYAVMQYRNKATHTCDIHLQLTDHQRLSTTPAHELTSWLSSRRPETESQPLETWPSGAQTSRLHSPSRIISVLMTPFCVQHTFSCCKAYQNSSACLLNHRDKRHIASIVGTWQLHVCECR